MTTMLLGTLITQLENDADAGAVLMATGDLVLQAEVAERAALHDVTPGEYAAFAVSRFSGSASDEDWMSVVSALERGDDPAHAVLVKMLRWAIAKDRQDDTDTHAGCSCGSGGCQSAS
jgi:hypothetical protein